MGEAINSRMTFPMLGRATGDYESAFTLFKNVVRSTTPQYGDVIQHADYVKDWIHCLPLNRVERITDKASVLGLLKEAEVICNRELINEKKEPEKGKYNWEMALEMLKLAREEAMRLSNVRRRR